VATTSYLKDVLMVVVLGVLIVGVPLAFGGHGEIFPGVQQLRPELLTIHGGEYNQLWFFTSMLVSGIGLACMTLPFMWQGVMSARSSNTLRRNYTYLPLYTLCLMLPLVVGLVVVGGAATAMVPSAAMVIGMSALIANNLLTARVSDRGRMRMSQLAVVAVCGFALLLALVRPDLLANLLLLTYSGLVQLAPGNILGLLRRRPRTGLPVILGILAGEVVVIWLTFSDLTTAGINVGIIGLAVNLAVLGATAWFTRNSQPEPDREAVPAHA
jgi:SSS family solute:Na+ symporter